MAAILKARRQIEKHGVRFDQIGDLNVTGDKIDSFRSAIKLSLTLTISLTLFLTLPDLNLTIFPSIHCLVSGRRSEPIIIQSKIRLRQWNRCVLN